MSVFSASWLARREPADAAARASALTAALVGHLAARHRPRRLLEVADLGAGTGAQLRYLAPRLAAAGFGDQRWSALECDPAVVEAGVAAVLAWGQAQGHQSRRAGSSVRLRAPSGSLTASWRRIDLGSGVASRLPERLDLVTASALLDLVSARWLDELAAACAERRLPLYAVLSYDGRQGWTPRLGLDEVVAEALNRHQRSEKGFGPALGPLAAGYAARALRGRGFSVSVAASDWQIGPDDSPLQRDLADQWAEVAAEAEPPRRAALLGWRDARSALAARGESRLLVGHLDLLAFPPEPR